MREVFFPRLIRLRADDELVHELAELRCWQDASSASIARENAHHDIRIRPFISPGQAFSRRQAPLIGPSWVVWFES